MRRVLLVAVLSFIPLAAQSSVLRIRVNDMIHPISDEYIGRGLASAAQAKDAAVVIELTTPGGLIDSTRSIVEKMMTSRVPVIVYVSPAVSRAASAGVSLLPSPLPSPTPPLPHT